jgi:putative heme-binding domain-containing protein
LKQALAGTNAGRMVVPLGNAAEKGMVPLLEPIVTDASRPQGLRKQVVRALAQVHPGAALLIRMAAEGTLPDDLRFSAASELNNARWAPIKTQAARLLPLPRAADAQPLPPVAELIKLSGDATKGAAVFRRDAVGCIKCHQVNGEGIDYGPSLSDIGAKLGKDALYESILDPSAGISFGYEAWRLALQNGDDANGLIVSETTDELALKTVGGIVTRYKKSGVAGRTQQKLSIMPADLQKTMSSQDLVDLVEYLTTLKTTPTASGR